jgi:hypothetical protein
MNETRRLNVAAAARDGWWHDPEQSEPLRAVEVDNRSAASAPSETTCHPTTKEDNRHDEQTYDFGRPGCRCRGIALGLRRCACTSPHERLPLPALGMTSPLGIPNAPVGQTGIPIGATELATPGVSPTTSGAAPMIGATCAGASPTSASAAVTGMSGAPLFDGGGMAASAPGSCAASATASPPMASTMGPGSTVGRVGIPLGSTELGGGGLSPPSVALSPTPSAPVMNSLTPLGGMSPPATPSVSAAPSTPNLPNTQTGVPTIQGVPTTFGAPVTARGLGFRATR